jgi:phosphopantetheinyl transferase
LQELGDLNQMLERTPETLKLRDDELVAGALPARTEEQVFGRLRQPPEARRSFAVRIQRGGASEILRVLGCRPLEVPYSRQPAGKPALSGRRA